MDGLESKKEYKKLQKISLFEIILICILMMPAIGCWWQIIRWLNGEEVPFMNNGALIGFLITIAVSTPPVFIITKEIRRYKKYKEVKINTNHEKLN
jgi:hypothetical protein